MVNEKKVTGWTKVKTYKDKDHGERGSNWQESSLLSKNNNRNVLFTSCKLSYESGKNQ